MLPCEEYNSHGVQENPLGLVRLCRAGVSVKRFNIKINYCPIKLIAVVAVQWVETTSTKQSPYRSLESCFFLRQETQHKMNSRQLSAPECA